MAKNTKNSVSSNQVLSQPLPNNLDAERSILGAIMLDNKALDEAIGIKPEDFFLDQHRHIYKRMVALSEEHRPIDLVTLHDELLRQDELESVGGTAYLSSLGDGMPRVSNVGHHAKIVRENALRRNIIHTANRIQEYAFESEAPATILDHATESFIDLALQSGVAIEEGKNYREAALACVERLKKRDEIKAWTGVKELDDRTGAFRPGELITITAGTGVGKTILAQQTRRRACMDGLHSLYCSGEMTAEHLVSRELATAVSMEHWKMRHPDRIEPQEHSALALAAKHECEKCRILDGELSLRSIRLTARRKKRASGLHLLIVDYDELVDADGRNEFEQQRNLIRGLKRIAMELNIPVIVISQLRKSLDKDEAQHPTLERLYGSGAKSKHSSFVIFVDREWVRTMAGDETEAWIYILKSRDGRTGRFPVTFNVRTLRFEGVAQASATPPAAMTSGIDQE